VRGKLEGGFLEDIIANIDDDTPRLVYADWLMENGHDERAELIRVQIQQYRLPDWDPAQVSLRLREKELLKAHGQQWLAEMPQIQGVEWRGFRRGIVAEVGFSSFECMRENIAAVRAAAPVEAAITSWPRRGDRKQPQPETLVELRELTLEGRPYDQGLTRLAQWPQLATLHSLHVLGLDRDDLATLLASPHLGKLRRLYLFSHGVGNSGIEQLVQAETLSSLEELDLTGAGYHESYYDDPVITAQGMATLARWPGLAGVRKLNLTGSDPGEGGLTALLASPYARDLQTLILRNSRLKGPILGAFVPAVAAMRLQELDLHSNPLGDGAAEPLVQAACLSELKKLGIDRCQLSSAAVRTLSDRADFWQTLRLLNLSYNPLGVEGLQPLLERFPPQLHTLELCDCDLDDDALVQLAQSPVVDRLLELNLSKNNFGIGALRTLGETEHLPALLVLRILKSQPEETLLQALQGSPLGQRLRELSTNSAEFRWGESYMPPYEEDDDYYQELYEDAE
jgi:uncharacterized protein (TIGR02996 family)